MKLPAEAHVAAVDGERFLLMRNCGTTAEPVLQHEIESLLVVAVPDTLGEMRWAYHKDTQAALLGEFDRQFTDQPGPDISKAIEAA